METFTSNSTLRRCPCCLTQTTTLCVNGACIICHREGLCGHK